MKHSRRNSALDRFFSKLLKWAAGRLIESIPVIGPIYKVASLVVEITSIEWHERPCQTA
jgi:hypothetical protein